MIPLSLSTLDVGYPEDLRFDLPIHSARGSHAIGFKTQSNREGRAYDPERHKAEQYASKKKKKEVLYVPVLGEELLAKIQAEKPKRQVGQSFHDEFRDLISAKPINPFKEMER